MLLSLSQSAKAEPFIIRKLAGITTEANESQLLKAPEPIVSRFSEKLIFANLLLLENAELLTVIMLDGNVNSLMSQPLKELEEMDVRLSERFTSRILLQELYLEVIDYQLFAVNTVEKRIGYYLWGYGK